MMESSAGGQHVHVHTPQATGTLILEQDTLCMVETQQGYLLLAFVSPLYSLLHAAVLRTGGGISLESNVILLQEPPQQNWHFADLE